MEHKEIDIFLDRLLRLASELDHLGSQFSDTYAGYDGNDFQGQSVLACDKLDNLILAATHETASEIGFLAHSIKTLVHFIEFRHTYKDFSADDLKEIIDDPSVSLTLKQELTHKYAHGDIKATLRIIHEIQHAWNSRFNNKSFQSICSLYH